VVLLGVVGVYSQSGEQKAKMQRAAQLKSHFASLLAPRQPSERARLPTGIPPIDGLSGGIPKAAFTEIIGQPSSGCTTLLFSIVREAMTRGEFCALIDVQDSFDPESAVEAGLQLPQLLWIRCGGSAEHALKAADLLILSGGFGIVAVDVGDLPETTLRRIPFSVWHRLKLGAEQSGITFITTARQIQAGSCSKLQLELRQHRQRWSDKLFRGLIVEATTKGPQQLQNVQFEALR
jgi:recombination protein RecA